MKIHDRKVVDEHLVTLNYSTEWSPLIPSLLQMTLSLVHIKESVSTTATKYYIFICNTYLSRITLYFNVNSSTCFMRNYSCDLKLDKNVVNFSMLTISLFTRNPGKRIDEFWLCYRFPYFN